MLGAADRRSSGRVLPPRRLGAFLTGVSGFMAVLRGSLVKEECADDRGIDGVEAPAVPGRESRSAAGQPLDGYRSYRGWRGQRHVRRADHRVAADTARPDDGRWRGHLGRQPLAGDPERIAAGDRVCDQRAVDQYGSPGPGRRSAVAGAAWPILGAAWGCRRRSSPMTAAVQGGCVIHGRTWSSVSVAFREGAARNASMSLVVAHGNEPARGTVRGFMGLMTLPWSSG